MFFKNFRLIIIVLFLSVSVFFPGLLLAQWLGDWDPRSVVDEGEFNDDYYRYRNDPVVADLTPDDQNLEKSVIVYSDSHIFVLDSDGILLFTIPMPQGENYTFRYTPAIGDVIGDDDPEIIVCAYRQSGTRELGKVFVFASEENGNNPPLARSNEFYGPGPPVLSDLESSVENSREDGEFEIIVSSYGGYSEQNYHEWYLRVFDLVLDEIWSVEEMDEWKFAADDNPSPNPIPNTCPAVGDVDYEWKKEIVVSSTKRIAWCTYDCEQEINSKFTDTHTLVFDPYYRHPAENPHYEIFGSIGPILADINNDGKIWVLLTARKKAFEGDDYPGLTGKMIVLDITASNPENYEHNSFDAEPYTGINSEHEDLFAAYPGISNDMFAVGDFNDIGQQGYNNNGQLLICANMGAINLFNCDVRDPLAWPVATDGEDGIVPAIGELASGQDDNTFRVTVNLQPSDDPEVYVYGIYFNNDADYQYDLDGENGTFGGNVIIDLDGDEDLEVLSRSYDNNGAGDPDDIVNIYARTMPNSYDGETENELCLIEWTQLQNGPRHTGLYAQVYGLSTPDGWLAQGNTYWRDRVIVVDDVTFGYDDINFTPPRLANLIIEDNTLVEFNDNTGLTITGVEWECNPLFEGNICYKPNVTGGKFWLDVHAEISLNDVRILNGYVLVNSSSEATFEDCYFVSDGTNSLTAITAEDAEVNFIDCVFKGYDTALLLDDCVGSIEGCTFEDMTYNAIELENCTAALTIEECVFNDNGGAAVYLYNSYPDVSDCDIQNSDYFPVHSC